MRCTFSPLLFLATVAISACVASGDTQMTNAPVIPVPDISSLKTEWIDGDCRSMAMNPTQHRTCIDFLASQLPPLDPEKREYFGEQYNPQKFMECAQKTKRGIDGACEKYRLRRIENPEYWPYPDVPKPKWPEAPKKSVYKLGMSSKQYFDALCKAEAGEFIYKTVENVEGVYQVRPRSRQEYGDYFQEDRYVLEDPYGYTLDEATYTGVHYKFFEYPSISQPLDTQKFIRREGKTEVEVSKLNSRYGYMWRGISRPHDRELGIAGGEFMVTDLQSGEILAFHRGFSRSGYIRNNQSGFFWLSAMRCPSYKTWDYTTSILINVLKPIGAH